MRRIPMGRVAPTGHYWSRHSKELLAYESGQERKFLILMSAAYGVHALETQSRTLSLVVNGKRRSYTPDVLVTWRKGYKYPHGARKVWFEVKTREDLRRGVREYGPLFRAARAELANEGIGFRVVTERTFTALKLFNAEEMIKRHRKAPAEALYTAARNAFTVANGPLMLKEVANALIATGALRYKAWDAIWYWIGWRYLDCDVTAPINDNTVARWWWIPLAEDFDEVAATPGRSNRLR